MASIAKSVPAVPRCLHLRDRCTPNTARSFSSSTGSGRKAYPLYPSVQHLLHSSGLSTADAAHIKPSGPGGRLLKGDVLAHLGQIAKSYPSESAQRLAHLGKLDLSNVKIAPRLKSPTVTNPSQLVETEQKKVELAISLAAVSALRERVQQSLGIELSVSTLVARASELVNRDLTRGGNKRKSIEDELSDAVLLGSSRSCFTPVMTPAARKPTKQQRLGVFDEILRLQQRRPTTNISPSQTMFSVTARTGQEKSAAAFLSRIKNVLEREPGSLVL